jgi:pyruvate dehydrogenase E1 component alpha subunit
MLAAEPQRGQPAAATSPTMDLPAPPGFVDVTSERLEPIEITGIPGEHLLEWLETMVLIREFETKANALSFNGRIPGGIHTSLGQEAIAVGSIRALAPQDLVVGSHRTHHHAIAKGLTADTVMAELYGRATGIRGGRGGTIHLADWDRAYIGGNGIVGASAGIATGTALASKMRRLDQVSVAYFGDGAINTGRSLEAFNLAAIWHLPVIFICENNQYAVEARVEDVTGGGSIVERASAFGLRAIRLDGNDVGAVFHATQEARQRAVAGEAPTFIEAVTYRYSGHSTAEDMSWRPEAELEAWQTTKDPIARLRQALVEQGGITDEGYAALRGRVATLVDDAIQFAEDSPQPDTTDDALLAGVTGMDLKIRTNP